LKARFQRTLLRAAQDLGVDVTAQLQTLSVEEPQKRKGGVILGSAAELVDKLRNEAKVI
jgi:electron transfer flavoprotein beta subunit